MCDFSPIRNWLIAAGVAIGGAIALITVAAIENASFWLAWKSPITMGLAAAATGGAILSLGQARSAVKSYYDCMTRNLSGVICKGAYDSLRSAIVGMMTVLGFQASAAGAAAAVAWIPWVAQPSMWTILGSLVVQAALIPTIIGFAVALRNCLQKARSALGRRTGPLTSSGVDVQVATCSLNVSGCADREMKSAREGSSGTYSTSKTFAVLLTTRGNLTIRAVKATITDAFRKTVSIPPSDIEKPNNHQILNPSAWAVRCRWTVLSSSGVRVEPSARDWQVSVTADLSNSSQETLKLKFRVSD